MTSVNYGTRNRSQCPPLLQHSLGIYSRDLARVLPEGVDQDQTAHTCSLILLRTLLCSIIDFSSIRPSPMLFAIYCRNWQQFEFARITVDLQ